MPLAGWTYYQNLTDASGTALTNFPVKVVLSATGIGGTAFRFDLCKVDGSDIRIYDETSSASLNYWLMDFDPIGSSCTVFYKANNTANSHSINYGNAGATSLSNFSGVFATGTGFDADFGTLTTRVAGTGIAVRLAAATGITDPRYRQVWRKKSTPVLTATGISTQWQFMGGFDILKDTNSIAIQESGVYIAYAGVRNAAGGGNIIRALSTDGNVWGNYSTVLTSGLIGVDDIYCNFPFTYKVASGDYRMWYIARNIVNGVTLPAYANSTDGLNWNKQGITLDGTSLVSGVNNIGSFAITKLNDGITYLALIHAATGTLVPSKIFGYISTNLSGWNVINGGNPLLDTTIGGFDSATLTNPKPILLNNNIILIQYASSTGISASPNQQIGFATATNSGGPWTKDTNNPMMGLSVGPFSALSTSNLCFDTDGKSLLNYHTESGGNWGPTSIFRSYPVITEGGFLRDTVITDATIAGCVIVSGTTFSANSYSWMTANRSETSAPNLLSLFDCNTTLSPFVSTNPGDGRRLEIQRQSYDTPTYGQIILAHYSGVGVTRNFWNGSTWTTTTSRIAANFSRPIIANIKDDGTNFISTVSYADDNSIITSASIAKSIVTTFISGTSLYIGDPFTDIWVSPQFFRYITVGPYAATDPFIVLGSLQSQGGGPPSGITVVKTIFGGTSQLCYMGAFSQ